MSADIATRESMPPVSATVDLTCERTCHKVHGIARYGQWCEACKGAYLLWIDDQAWLEGLIRQEREIRQAIPATDAEWRALMDDCAPLVSS